jgi:hypothetical protein
MHVHTGISDPFCPRCHIFCPPFLVGVCQFSQKISHLLSCYYIYCSRKSKMVHFPLPGSYVGTVLLSTLLHQHHRHCNYCEAHPRCVILVAVINAPSLMSTSALLLLLSPSPFPLPSLFPSPSPSASHFFQAPFS